MILRDDLLSLKGLFSTMGSCGLLIKKNKRTPQFFKIFCQRTSAAINSIFNIFGLQQSSWNSGNDHLQFLPALQSFTVRLFFFYSPILLLLFTLYALIMLFPAALGDRALAKQTPKILKHWTATILPKKGNIILPFKMLLLLKSKVHLISRVCKESGGAAIFNLPNWNFKSCFCGKQ